MTPILAYTPVATVVVCVMLLGAVVLLVGVAKLSAKQRPYGAVAVIALMLVVMWWARTVR